MKRAIGWMLGLTIAASTALGQGAVSGDLTDPVEILKKVDAAAKALKGVKYEVSSEGTGALKERAGSVKATFIGVGRGEGGTDKYVCKAEIKKSGSEEITKIEAGSDGKTFYLIDHKNKKVHQDIDPSVIGMFGQQMIGFLMAEYLHPTPFTDEINGERHELKAETKIEGEDCYQVHVKYKGMDREATWFFSKKDFLPRARRDFFKSRTGEEAGQIKTVAKLVADPKVTDDDFKVTVPEGYTKTDEFAP